ncbi:hypothetical protein [Streptomyces amakusaensis]|uniref:Uncharacterized protein n=1 Tax=Streptomyces amakusaensis TaxID=67271 RepID=A0ABW0AS66_9ACTN
MFGAPDEDVAATVGVRPWPARRWRAIIATEYGIRLGTGPVRGDLRELSV